MSRQSGRWKQVGAGQRVNRGALGRLGSESIASSGVKLIVALVDDDAEFNASAEHALSAAGFQCVAFREGREFLNAAQRTNFDAVLLDWNMPGLSGLDVVKELRGALACAVPILMVTVRSADHEVVEGLNAGADDFVVKPAASEVLVARLRAILRRGGREEMAAVEDYGPYRFDTRRVQAARDGAWLDLTTREFWLARLLFQNLGKPVARSFLIQKVWGHADGVESRTLDAHISRLRRKLDLRPARGFRLAMVYGYGYRLEAIDGAS